MKFWCWIPHINASLEQAWPENELEDILIGTPEDDVKFGLHIDDDEPDEYWITKFTATDGRFEYDKKCIRCCIDDRNGNDISIDIMIMKNGIVCYELGVNDSDEDYCRHLINELNYLVKNLLHDHVYHDADPIHDLSKGAGGSEKKEYNRHPDYYISPVRAETEADAVSEIDRLFTKSLDRFIKKWKSLGEDRIVPENERKLAFGYIVFGRSFCNCTREIRNTDSDPEKAEASLEQYEAIIRDITEDAKRKEAKKNTDEVNENIMRLTICTSLLTIVSIIVAYFAGSSLANMLTDTETTVAVTISVGVVSIIAVVAIFSAYGIWNVLSKGHPCKSKQA